MRRLDARQKRILGALGIALPFALLLESTCVSTLKIRLVFDGGIGDVRLDGVPVAMTDHRYVATALWGRHTLTYRIRGSRIRGVMFRTHPLGFPSTLRIHERSVEGHYEELMVE